MCKRGGKCCSTESLQAAWPSFLFGCCFASVAIIVFLKFFSSVTLVIQWVDVTQLEKNATLLFPECIKVSTRDSELYFSMFLNINETFKLMEQLANIAMRQLLDNESFLQDKSLPKPRRPLKNISALKRYYVPSSEKRRQVIGDCKNKSALFCNNSSSPRCYWGFLTLGAASLTSVISLLLALFSPIPNWTWIHTHPCVFLMHG